MHKVITLGKGGPYSRINNMSITPTSFTEKISDLDKVILISLQDKSQFPTFIVQTIEEFGDGYLWIFKTHLLRKFDAVPGFDLQELKRQTNVIWDENHSSEQLLDCCDIHLTAYSTMGFDAIEFNVPTIFFHDNAKKSFQKDFAECGYFHFSITPPDVAKSIQMLADKGEYKDDCTPVIPVLKETQVIELLRL